MSRLQIRWPHVLAFLLGVLGIWGTAASGSLQAGQELSVSALVLALSGSTGLVWALFAHTILPDITGTGGDVGTTRKMLGGSGRPPPMPRNSRGPDLRMPGFVVALCACVPLVFCTGATCTPQAVVAVAVQVAVDVCQEAPNLLPPTTTAGTIVALVCEVVDPKTGVPLKAGQTVFVDAKQWNAAKLEYLRTRGHLPGGMSPAVQP